jgi:hypothetical protein
MTPEQLQTLVREQEPFVFDRMFGAVEKVRERLERTCRALEGAGIPYAVIGGNAVAAWVATKDDGAVRNTRDVDILLRDEDLDRATEAMQAVGFHRDKVMDVTVFLDGPDGKPSQGVHVLRAGQKVKESYATPTPQIEQSIMIDGKRIVELTELVGMKLNSYRRKDQTHLQDMIGVGLIDATWPARFEPSLGERLQTLLDDPDG